MNRSETYSSKMIQFHFDQYFIHDAIMRLPTAPGGKESIFNFHVVLLECDLDGRVFSTGFLKHQSAISYFHSFQPT